ncbi:unnamed protein product, partial [Symbiodinium pilosum]
MKEGEVGSTVLSIVEQIIRAESNTDGVSGGPVAKAARSKVNKAPSSGAPKSYYPASCGPAASSAPGKRVERATGFSKGGGPAAQNRWCDFCGSQVPAAMGSFDNDATLWYCFNCWQ